jgi:hypothetical protein
MAHPPRPEQGKFPMKPRKLKNSYVRYRTLKKVLLNKISINNFEKEIKCSVQPII